jgi:hypothetical protein
MKSVNLCTVSGEDSGEGDLLFGLDIFFSGEGDLLFGLDIFFLTILAGLEDFRKLFTGLWGVEVALNLLSAPIISSSFKFSCSLCIVILRTGDLIGDEDLRRMASDPKKPLSSREWLPCSRALDGLNSLLLPCSRVLEGLNSLLLK